jgi:hypothetical protein
MAQAVGDSWDWGGCGGDRASVFSGGAIEELTELELLGSIEIFITTQYLGR